MVRIFKRKQFRSGVFINLKVLPTHTALITDMLHYILDEEMFPIRSLTVGGGHYMAIHTEDNARKLQKFIKKWRIENESVLSNN